ncbi:MAG TPA: hypothetical protein VGR44_02255 [Methylomirabilota bacterium]|jgi:hypothetical protein|nr:hypothetical protein [Methylomirabilota bacterium]
MAMLGRAVLAFWHDVIPEGREEFDRWHIREHVPERLAVPGFLRFRRYEVVRGSAAYFYFYETESVATLSSPAYVARLNDPTPWTRKVLPSYRNTKRTACRVMTTLGDGIGGSITTLEFGPAAGRADELRAWLADTALPEAMERRRLVGAHLCEADVEATLVKTTKTTEGKLQDRPDELARWILLLEAIGPEAAESAGRDLLGSEGLGRRGAAADVTTGLYRLHFVQSR